MGQRGFTLAELLVAVAVLAFIMAAIVGLQQQGQLAYLVGAARVEVQQNARVALDLMMAEIRSARAITASANCNNAASGTNDIRFDDQNGSDVRYRQNGTTLERNGAVVVGGVQSLVIRCYRDDGTTLTQTPADVRTVHVTITTQTEKGTSPGSPTDQHAIAEARVRLRNVL
jgi:prepilin-type N-terminal cleavage/methylation domain-containing protein